MNIVSWDGQVLHSSRMVVVAVAVAVLPSDDRSTPRSRKNTSNAPIDVQGFFITHTRFSRGYTIGDDGDLRNSDENLHRSNLPVRGDS